MASAWPRPLPQRSRPPLPLPLPPPLLRVTGKPHRSASPLCAPPAPPRRLHLKKAKRRRPRQPRSRRSVLRGPCPPRARLARTPELGAPRGRRLNRHREGAGAAGPRGFWWLLRGLGGLSFPLAVRSRARPVSLAQYGQMLLLHGGDTVPAAAGG